MISGEGSDTVGFFSGIVIPILIFIAGIIASVIGSAINNIIARKIALLPYSKSAHIELDLQEKKFKVFNTGRGTIVIKRIGISKDRKGKEELYSTEKLVALTVERDPLVIDIDINDFVITVESSIGGDRYPKTFYCFISDPHGKKYCSKSSEDLWADHELHFGRNPNESSDSSELPF
jgi:hypothetical protein